MPQVKKLGVNKSDSPQMYVSAYKPGISSIFSWFGKKDKNEIEGSCVSKNFYKFKLNSLDLDSLNLNSKDLSNLKSNLKMAQNGTKPNIFRVSKQQLELKEDGILNEIIALNSVKDKKRQCDRPKFAWSATSMSISTKQKTQKTFKTTGIKKSHRSIVSSSSSSKTTLKVHYKKSSKLNVPKSVYRSILMESIPPDILKSNIEKPVFVPIRCIGKRNVEFEKSSIVEPDKTVELNENYKTNKTKVIPVLLKKLNSTEIIKSNVLGTTGHVEVKKLNLPFGLQSKSKEQTEGQLTKEWPESNKIRPKTVTKKKKRVKANKLIKIRGKSSASRRSPNSDIDSSNLKFVFEPKTFEFNAFASKDNALFHSQALPKEAKFMTEVNAPVKTLFDAYPGVGCGNSLHTYQVLPKESDCARLSQEFEKSCKLNLPPCEVFDCISTSVECSEPLDKNSLFVNEHAPETNKVEKNVEVLQQYDVSKQPEVSSKDLLSQIGSCPKCGCSIGAIRSERFEKTNERENNPTEEQENVDSGIEIKAPSNDEIEIKPEMMTESQRCDKLQESLLTKLLEAIANEKLKHGNCKDPIDDGNLSGLSEPKSQFYNTRSILTTSEGLKIDNEFPISHTLQTCGQLYLQERIKPVDSFEFQSAGRGDVRSSTNNNACVSLLKESLKETSSLIMEDTQFLFRGECSYLNREKRKIFNAQGSKTSIRERNNKISPTTSLVHCMADDGIGDSTLEGLETEHYWFDSGNAIEECAFFKKLENDKNLLRVPKYMAQDQPTVESKCVIYYPVVRDSPRTNKTVEEIIPRLTVSSGFFRVIDTESDTIMENKDQKIQDDSRRRPGRVGFNQLQDIEEIIDGSEEEDKDMINDSDIKEGKSAHNDENPILNNIVDTRTSTVSVQTDWSLVGITAEHFHSSTCLSSSKISVACQTDVTNDGNEMSGHISKSTRFFDALSDGMYLQHPYFNIEASSGGRNNNLEIKMSQLLNKIKDNSKDLDTVDFKVITQSSGCKTDVLTAYKSEARHVCTHPCFASFSGESIDFNVDDTSSDAFIRRDFLSNLSSINSEIIRKESPSHILEDSEFKNLTSLVNMFQSEGLASRFTAPDAKNVDEVFRFGTENHTGILENDKDSAPVQEHNEEGETSMEEPPFPTMRNGYQYVVNCLYMIEYDWINFQ